jgi:hypothetical protein
LDKTLKMKGHVSFLDYTRNLEEIKTNIISNAFKWITRIVANNFWDYFKKTKTSFSSENEV